MRDDSKAATVEISRRREDPRRAGRTSVSVRRRSGTVSVVLVLGGVLAVAIAASACVGAVHIPIADALRALVNAKGSEEARTILFTLRLPRILSAALVGAALASAGVLFQGLFRNPLADPFVLGTSGGAALGGAVAVFLIPTASFLGFSAMGVLAFAGALLAMMLVWNLSRRGGAFAMENMLLAGFAVGTMLNAATAAVQIGQQAAHPGSRIFMAWLQGEIGVPTWSQIAVVVVCELVAIGVAIPISRRLDTLALGDEYAAQLGVRVERVRIVVVVLGSLLTALAVSLGGLIGFIGLLIPHFLRMLIGPEHARLLPAAALGGAAFLVVTDTIARTAFSPAELPVGILAAFLGGPAFLWIMNHRRRDSAL